MQDQTSEPCPDIIQLKQEFEKLSEEQLLALRSATYLGMTPQEAKTYDVRRRKITELVKRLSNLRTLQEN
jgi:hypothetical protein